MLEPIAVFRYAGTGPSGLAPRFGDSLTPHADTARLCETARAQGWRVLKHRPLGEVSHGDKMDADTASDQIDAGRAGLVLDFIEHAKPDDMHYWGHIESADLLAAWDSGDWQAFYRRLALTCMVIKRAGGTPILDHAGGSDHPANRAWIEMVRATGAEPVLEPWIMWRGGFCLERWWYREMLADDQPEAGPHVPSIRWYSLHPLEDGTLPWNGNVAHWIRHVTAHGHTPAMNVEDIDLSATASEFLDRVRKGDG